MSMELIKKLREQTGAGMVDCKKALEEANGNIEEATEALRKKGIAKAAKRVDREACEGVILVDTNEEGNEGYILEVNSETDFVARNEQFQGLAKNILSIIKNKKPSNLEDLMQEKAENGTVQEELDNLSGTIGEKLGVNNFAVLSGATVGAYSHMGGKIGVLVALDKPGQKEVATDIAMQIAATNPQYLTPEEVPAEVIEKEKGVYREQLSKEGKPENIIDNILEGKINKYFEEVCLVKQEFIKDDKKKVEEILGDSKIEKFIRYSL